LNHLEVLLQHFGIDGFIDIDKNVFVNKLKSIKSVNKKP